MTAWMTLRLISLALLLFIFVSVLSLSVNRYFLNVIQKHSNFEEYPNLFP